MIDNPSGKKNIIMIASVTVVLVAVIGVLLHGIFSTPTSSRQELGSSSLSMADENGDKWVLDMVKGPSLSGFKDSSVKPGPPLLVKTDVQISGLDASIGLVIEGKAGEKYIGGAQKNGQMQPAPGLKIVDGTGKTLTTGAFKYG